MRRRLLAGLLTLCASLFASPGRAQAPSAVEPLAVFLDCSFFCDGDFIRTEITYVSWVRDRTASDVHVLVTQQGTGGGGTEYTLAFLGQRSFAAMADTVRYLTAQSATSDEVRRGMTRVLKLGLVRFLANGPLAPRLNVTLAPQPGAAQPTAAPPRDPWNLWVLSVGTSGSFSGERSSKFKSGGANTSARRTTAEWKVELGASVNYNESEFDFGAGTSRFIRRNVNVRQLVVKSLGPRTAIGVRGAQGSSTVENKALFARLTPAFEFDVFPYSESTRRMLTLQYSVGAEHFEYEEETIYFKMRETRPVHSLSITLNQTQPWGSAFVGAEASQYLDETNRNGASVFGGGNVRLFKGFSVSLSGGASSIHNQLYIARGGATPEEVLLQQRRLQTSYSFNGSLRVNYTFGSVFNSIVNPRFGGGNFFFFF